MFSKLLLSALFFTASAHAMYDPAAVPAGYQFMGASYNVENLFDVVDDPNKDDSEYLPGGKAQWTEEKLHLKVQQLSKVIRSLNVGRGPDFIALPETENINALSMLNNEMKDLGYQPVLVEGPDERGIDVGFLTRFPVVGTPSGVRVEVPGDPLWKKPTRMITKVTLQISRNSQVLVLLNHWPSRFGTEALRCRAGQVTRQVALEEQARNPNLPVIIMGDLNDEPENNSLLDCLGTAPAPFVLNADPRQPLFYNTYYDAPYQNRNKRGTYYYAKDDEWDALDHIILSRNLLQGGPVAYVPGSFQKVVNKINARTQTEQTKFGVLPVGSPLPFAVIGAAGSLKAVGASDHFPVIAWFKVLR